MFWKSKTKRPRLFEYESDCRRESYRVAPPSREPVWVDFGGQAAELLDISAGGLSLKCAVSPASQPGQERMVRFLLPGAGAWVRARARVVAVDQPDTCHCAFIEPEAETVETIHQYALRVQKQELRRDREARIQALDSPAAQERAEPPGPPKNREEA